MDFISFLLKRYSQRPYIIITDSYYSSLELTERLHKLKLGVLLSCRGNRPNWLFSNYFHLNLEKKNWNYVYNSKFSAITYYDKAKVNLITNLFKKDKVISNSDNTNTINLLISQVGLNY